MRAGKGFAIATGVLLVFSAGLGVAFWLAFTALRPTLEWSETDTRVVIIQYALADYYADHRRFPSPAEGLGVLLLPPPSDRSGPRYFPERYILDAGTLVDSWGTPIGYAASEDGCVVFSFGADRAPGGFLRDDQDVIRRCSVPRTGQPVALNSRTPTE